MFTSKEYLNQKVIKTNALNTTEDGHIQNLLSTSDTPQYHKGLTFERFFNKLFCDRFILLHVYGAAGERANFSGSLFFY